MSQPISQESAEELLSLVQEALRAGNANTRALKQALHKASPSWCRRAREAVEKARPFQPRIAWTGEAAGKKPRLPNCS